jgi:tetratricopeptide (TPR) repeat protein
MAIPAEFRNWARYKLYLAFAMLMFAASLVTRGAVPEDNSGSFKSAQQLLDKIDGATDAQDWQGAAACCSVPYLSGDNVILTGQNLADSLQDWNKLIVSSTCRVLGALDKTQITQYLPDIAKQYAADADLIVRIHEVDRQKDGKVLDLVWGGFFRTINGRLLMTAGIDDPVGMIVDKGDTKRFAGDQPEAIAIYNLAIKVAPDDAEAYNMRAFSHEDQSDYAAANADFAKAVEFSPQDSIYRENLADSLSKLGKDDDANKEFSEAIRLDPANIDAFMDRGRMRDKQGDLKGAVADFSQALSIPPPYPTSYNIEGWMISQQALIYKFLGDSKMEQKDFTNAAAAYTTAINVCPKYPQAYEARAKAKAALNDTAGSDQDIATAKQIRADPNKFPTLTAKDIVRTFTNWFK